MTKHAKYKYRKAKIFTILKQYYISKNNFLFHHDSYFDSYLYYFLKIANDLTFRYFPITFTIGGLVHQKRLPSHRTLTQVCHDLRPVQFINSVCWTVYNFKLGLIQIRLKNGKKLRYNFLGYCEMNCLIHFQVQSLTKLQVHFLLSVTKDFTKN